MNAIRFDAREFFQRPNAVAALVSSAEAFSLIRRAFELPAQWAALVTRDTGDRSVVAAGGRVERDGVEYLLCARTTPFELAFEEDDLITRDRFACSAKVFARARLVADRGELDSFGAAVLGSHRVATVQTVQRHLQSVVRHALMEVGMVTDAASLVSGAGASDAAAVVHRALQAACFTAGIVLEAMPAVRFESATYREVQGAEERAARARREQELARELRETRDQARRERLDHVATMLARLERMASDSPDVDMGRLIQAFAEHERAELYEALLARADTSARTRWLVAVTSDEVMFFDPHQPARPQRRLTLQGSAGPMRSIVCVVDEDGRAELLIGAATGIYLLAPDRTEPRLTLIVPGGPAVQGGFNTVTRCGQIVLASHSELGLFQWSIEQPSTPVALFTSMTQSARSVRGVAVRDGMAYCAVDDRVVVWPLCSLHRAAETAPERILSGSRSPITALCPAGSGVYGGNQAGQVLWWDGVMDTRPQTLYVGSAGAVESIFLRTLSGLEQIVFADRSAAVHARVVSDNFTAHFVSPGQKLRRAEVSADLVAGVNDLRDRILLWPANSPNEPMAAINVGALCGRSIQDICLITA